jgi:hypothetical protein
MLFSRDQWDAWVLLTYGLNLGLINIINRYQPCSRQLA